MPAIGDDGVVLLRRPAVVVLEAPKRTLISLDVLHRACEHEMQVTGDLVTIAGQVVYQVTGWQAFPPALRAVLVEDRRTLPEAP